MKKLLIGLLALSSTFAFSQSIDWKRIAQEAKDSTVRKLSEEMRSLVTISPYAATIVYTDEGARYRVGILEETNTVDDYSVELFWLNGGGSGIYTGDVCFTGKRQKAITLLEELDKMDIIDDEHSFKNITSSGESNIKYEIYDSSNQEVVRMNNIEKCVN